MKTKINSGIPEQERYLKQERDSVQGIFPGSRALVR